MHVRMRVSVCLYIHACTYLCLNGVMLTESIIKACIPIISSIATYYALSDYIYKKHVEMSKLIRCSTKEKFNSDLHELCLIPYT